MTQTNKILFIYDRRILIVRIPDDHVIIHAHRGSDLKLGRKLASSRTLMMFRRVSWSPNFKSLEPTVFSNVAH